jgi:hypothetical protein
MELHTRSLLLGLSVISTVALVGCGGEISADSQSEPPQAPLTLLWEKGSAEASPEQDFGRIVDATLDGELNAYVLDVATKHIAVFDKVGRPIKTLSRTGRGPGELMEPVSLVHDDDVTLYVLDRVNGLVSIPTDSNNGRTATSTPLPLIASDFCLSQGKVIVFGAHNGHTLHEMTLAGEILRSFGEFDGPKEHPRHLPALNSDGKVACFPEQGIVVTVPKLFPVVRAYRMTDGASLWADTVRGVVPWGVVVSAEMYSTGQHRDGSDESIVLRPLGTDQAVIQYRRSHQIDSAVATCVVAVRTGGCRAVRDSTPRLVAARHGHVLSFTQGDYHSIALYRLNAPPDAIRP